ncbi:MAG TPA: hypothetical protein VG815_17350 [Chloroflexota bacterium]|jgi:glyoxylase-like metal-dependent hydrolase (beta-lactamase superfamily II)|nr:hypothetical protein [Chloroflexota bacterium]
MVVDPRWDIEPYLEIARKHGFAITHIVETRNHADHVSGHGSLLVAATGAAILIHESAGVGYLISRSVMVKRLLWDKLRSTGVD